MSLSPYEIALIGVGSSILGALIGGFLTYRFQLSLAYRAAFNATAREFRDAFIGELIFFANRENSSGLYDTINNALLTKHFPAMLIFRAVLKGKTKKKFEYAWQDYAADKNARFSLYAEPPFPMPSLTRYHDGLEMPDESIGEREKVRQLVIKRLEHILSFAKPI